MTCRKRKEGFLINADVNGGYNIGRKAFPNAFIADGIEGVGLHPKIVVI
jgi:putative transposase